MQRRQLISLALAGAVDELRWCSDQARRKLGIHPRRASWDSFVGLMERQAAALSPWHCDSFEDVIAYTRVSIPISNDRQGYPRCLRSPSITSYRHCCLKQLSRHTNHIGHVPMLGRDSEGSCRYAMACGILICIGITARQKAEVRCAKNVWRKGHYRRDHIVEIIDLCEVRSADGAVCGNWGWVYGHAGRLKAPGKIMLMR